MSNINNVTKKYSKREIDNINEQYYRFNRIPKNKQKRIITLLGYCKEIRNTAYPMQGSDVTELKIVEFSAQKEKDMYYINGSLSLIDGDRIENRVMEAYIFDTDEKITIYMDVTRLCVNDEPKMIRTSENFVETANTIMAVSKYAGCGLFEEKVYSEEFPKTNEPSNYMIEYSKQLAPTK